MIVNTVISVKLFYFIQFALFFFLIRQFHYSLAILMTPDELKTLSKGNFIVTKTGVNPMKSILKLFFKWGITFNKIYTLEEKGARVVSYADKAELEAAIIKCYNIQISQAHVPAKDGVPNAGHAISEINRRELRRGGGIANVKS